MMPNILTPLTYRVPIAELQEYYNILVTKYQHLDWSWEKCGGDVIKQWKDAAYADPANLLTHGWAIQSNLKDITLPCPPWNISTLETVEYRNTELAFGIIETLQRSFPFAYRWAVSVQPPGGTVSLHSDQEDEYTVWIPIYTNGVAITFVTPERTTGYCLESNGSLYLLNTTIPHFTSNESQEDRVTIIFRFNKQYLDTVLNTL